MKKIVLIGVLLTSSLGFSRIINECQIMGKSITGNGVRMIDCFSLETGKEFKFTNVSKDHFENMLLNEVYKLYFSGQGYDKLRIDEREYIRDADCGCM